MGDAAMKQPDKLSTYIYKLAAKYRLYISALVTIAVVASLFDIAVTYKIKEIIDTIHMNPGTDVALLLVLFALYKLMYHGLYFIGRLFDIKYKPAILTEVITDMYTKTVRHSLHWFDSHLSGEISSKITDFHESLKALVTDIYMGLGNLATIIIGMIFLMIINHWAAWVIIGFILIYTPVLGVLLKKQLNLMEGFTHARQEASGIINDSIANIFAIKIIGNVWAELKLKLMPAIDKWREWDRKTRVYDAYYVDLIDAILVTIAGAAQIWLLAYLYQNGKITAGEFTFIAITTLSIHKELGNFLESVLFSINPRIATLKSSYSFISAQLDVMDTENATVLPRVRGEIKYEEVSFGYGDSADIFANLNLHILPGQRVGIVGTSGAGKTTFIKCLLRYFDLRSGRILIDGMDTVHITQESLRANISVIPQDISMFHRSILENLQLAKPDATQEEIESACRKARIHDDIVSLPKGYSAIVGERGVKVSGGQRQRIAIARAILKNAPILILDEATSALDTPTEKLIQESLYEIIDSDNFTTIVIAHRLSTLLHMDRILVFDHGKIIEDGVHAELLAKGGVYKTLWNAQVGGFLPDDKDESAISTRG